MLDEPRLINSVGFFVASAVFGWLLYLKITHQIAFSWWWILAPWWIMLLVLALTVLLAITGALDRFEDWRRKKGIWEYRP